MAWQLAQLNLARPVRPLDTPALAAFVAALGPMNALADAAPGFVWRLQTAAGNATALRLPTPDGDDSDLLINLSVWDSVLALADFVYSGEHLEVMRRRREWFVPLDQAVMVLWWVSAGHRPTIVEAAERLDALRRQGPSLRAFTFRTAYPAPDEVSVPV